MKKHIKTVNKAMINKTLRNTNNQLLQKTSVLNSSLLMRGAVFI